MRNISSPLDGFASPFGQRRGVQIISAIIQPSLAPLVAGDTIEDNISADIDQTTNYTSTKGTIASVVVAVLVNGETPASLDIPLDFEDVVSITVTVTDSEANVRVFNLGRTVAGIAPSNDVAPAIAGDTGLGDTLTVTAGTWSGVPEPTLTYQWLRGGVEIAGETGTTYVITLADSGASITVRETATNSEGSAFEVSNAITADTFTAPVNDVAPSISGDTDLGATLTRTEGTWSGNPTPTLSGQWQRDGVAIAGETGATYEVVSDDQGADITYRETATNAVGSVSVSSNAIAIPEAPVATVPDAFTAPDWDVANDGDTVSVNILTLPSDGGAPITDLEYRVNGGMAISLSETTTGSYPITAVEGDDIEIRAVNAIGAGDWSDVKAVPAAETFDPDALAYITAVETADGEALEAGVKDAINDFVVGCKADAIWDALKASCILAGARTLNGALVPLVGTAPTNFNFVSADYNRKTGLVGNGSTKYLNSNRANNADPQDNNHNAVFVSDTIEAGTKILIGSDGVNTSGSNNFFYRSVDLSIASRSGSPNEVSVAGQGRLVTGFKGMSRDNSDTVAVRSGGTNYSLTQSSATPTSSSIHVFDRGPTPPNLPTDARLSFYSIGEAVDLALLDTRVSALMTAIDGAIV
jgi:hypothetical protein